MAKSSVSFVEGIHITFGDAVTRKGLEQWFLVGYVEDIPFYLHYLGIGAAQWEAKGNLGPLLRKRILANFKKEVRHKTQPWVAEYVTDLFGKNPAQQAVQKASIDFYQTAWREKMLGDRDEDYIVLAVPYSDRQAALDAGAKWWPHKKVWAIHKTLDNGAVARWMLGAP